MSAKKYPHLSTRDSMLQCKKDYALRNPDKIKAAGKRAWLRKRDPSYIKKLPMTPEERKVHRKQYEYEHHLKKMYGITQTDYDEMLIKQNGVCAICGSSQSTGRSTKLRVDHNHTTTKVRGLLCDDCNLGLGHFKDDPNKLKEAINYLEIYREM